jgi:uncharacterized protein
MLIRFVVSNFLSFHEEREFNMLPGPFKTHKEHVYQPGKIKLEVLKAAAIYGANGAGKSNLIKAIDFLKELVKEGSIRKSVSNRKFKLNEGNTEAPVYFEIEFFTGGKCFSYGLTIQQTSVIEEWLYESGITKEDKLIFERKGGKSGNPSINVADKYKKSQKSRLLIELMEEGLLKHNELLLSKSDFFIIDELSVVRDWMSDKLTIIFADHAIANLVEGIAKSKRFRIFTNEVLNAFDTGVKKLEVEAIDLDKFFGEDNEDEKNRVLEEISDGKSLLYYTGNGVVNIKEVKGKGMVERLVSVHEDNNGKGIVFDLSEESDGTRRLLDFIPAFDFLLQTEGTVIIDEIDRSIHPSLLRTFIQKMMSDNGTKGQLIFTTHESNLLDLDIFRQDEIWFAEKDKTTGGTQLYSLSDFKPRYDLDIRKGYLKGRFGAIPFMANLNDLNWQDYEA